MCLLLWLLQLMYDKQAKRPRAKLADFGTAAPAAPIVEGRAVDNPLWYAYMLECKKH